MSRRLQNAVAILKHSLMKIGSPATALGSIKPYDMAEQLLDEIEQNMVPVWPTTETYADLLIEGLEIHQEARGGLVFKAVLLAPVDTVVDWRAKLAHLTNA